MFRYGQMIKQDGAIWLRFILKHLLTPQGGYKRTTNQQNKIPKTAPNQPRLDLRISGKKLGALVRAVIHRTFTGMDVVHIKRILPYGSFLC